MSGNNTSEYRVVALCAVGAEKAASNEIRKLGLRVEESGYGKIRFIADTVGLYRALMGLRAVDRVLLEAGWFPAADFDALFDGVRKIAWEDLIPHGMGLHIAKVRVNRSALRAETTIQAMVHKAAAERLCRTYGLRSLPEGGEGAELRVYLEKDHTQLLLDLSGDPLFKRGYRIEGGAAPLRETTAAAILLLSGWKRKFPLYDPFCGSGTILAEALLYAFDVAPGFGRRFAIEKLLVSDHAAEKEARKELASRMDFSRTVRIAGSDTDKRAVEMAKANLERALKPALDSAGIAARQEGAIPPVETLPMESARSSWNDSGFIVTNPPYGKRLGEPEDAEALYARMGALAQGFPEWKLAAITDHPGFESFFGKKADSCREVTNGAIQTYLYQYDKI